MPAPVACCLPRWPVACSNAPFPLLCCLPRWLVACPDVGPRLPGIARGWLRRPDGALSCEVRWLGPGLGQFCRRSRALEGELRPSGWCSGCFACRPARTASRAPARRVGVRAVLHVVRDDGEAVNSPIGLVFGLFCMRSGTFKGISSLCKCDSAYKVWWCWESRAAVQSSPSAADADPGIAVKAAHGAERLGLCARGLRGTAGTGPGAASGSGARARFSGRLPQKGPPSLVPGETHWGRKTPIGVGNLPTPMHCCLPQWPVAYPNASFLMLCCLPQ